MSRSVRLALLVVAVVSYLASGAVALANEPKPSETTSDESPAQGFSDHAVRFGLLLSAGPIGTFVANGEYVTSDSPGSPPSAFGGIEIVDLDQELGPGFGLGLEFEGLLTDFLSLGVRLHALRLPTATPPDGPFGANTAQYVFSSTWGFDANVLARARWVLTGDSALYVLAPVGLSYIVPDGANFESEVGTNAGLFIGGELAFSEAIAGFAEIGYLARWARSSRVSPSVVVTGGRESIRYRWYGWLLNVGIKFGK